MNGMNGLGKVLSPGMPQGVPQGIPLGMPQTIPQGMAQGIPQGMPQGLPQQIPQGMQQGVPGGHQIPSHTDTNTKNEENFMKELDSINNFLNIINEIQLPIPDKVINNICAQSGLSTSDPRLSRLLSLASQYIICQIISECRKSGNLDLQISDIKKALEKMNINVYRPEYIVNPIDQEATNIDDNQIFDLSSNMDDTQMFD